MALYRMLVYCVCIDNGDCIPLGRGAISKVSHVCLDRSLLLLELCGDESGGLQADCNIT